MEEDLLKDFVDFELKFRYANNQRLKNMRRKELRKLFERYYRGKM